MDKKKRFKLMKGNNLELLKGLPDNSIDSILTDPPYGLSFMNKKWDYDVPSVDFWKEAYRVLKPGGHVLSFGGTRTYHRMVVNMEDAGFEIRDQIQWLYSTGFPKSLNVKKQFEKNGYKVCECSEQNTEHDLRPLPETNIPQTINSESEQGQTLLQNLYEPNIQRAFSSDIKRTEQKEGLTRREEPSVERWSDAVQEEGKLQGNNIQESTRTSKTNGEEGRLYNGTQNDNGSNGEQIINENRSGSSYRPQSEQQSSKQSGTMADKRRPQESGSRKICGRCGEQIISGLDNLGTSLKPANEPICLARKPLSENSVAENVLKWRTGGINIDGCRIGTDDKLRKLDGTFTFQSGLGADMKGKKNAFVDAGEGRFPANIIFECICDEVIKGTKKEVKSNTRGVGGSFNTWSETDKKEVVVTRIEDYGDTGDIHTNPACPCYVLDKQSGISKPKKERTGRKGGTNESDFSKAISADPDFIGHWPGDNGGGASRFFYVAKVSKKERNMGLDHFEETESQQKGHGLDRVCMNEGCGVSMLKPELCKCQAPDWRPKPKKNSHPTVKPINLLTYLCRLITPPNGIVLDPFMGSGSTGIAAQLEGFRFCGMELDEDYFKIAEARIEKWEEYQKIKK